MFEEWEKRDPVKNYEQYLIRQNIVSQVQIDEIKKETKAHIESELALAYQAKPMVVDTNEEEKDLYAPKSIVSGEWSVKNQEDATHQSPLTSSQMRFIDGIQDALRLSMQKHHNLIIMGQDIAEYGGAFKITEGFVQEFGKERIRNTPICESAIVGAALGLSLEGYKAIMEMQFADFATVGFNQIINNLAKIHYRWGQNADVVIRMPTGGGLSESPKLCD